MTAASISAMAAASMRERRLAGHGARREQLAQVAQHPVLLAPPAQVLGGDAGRVPCEREVRGAGDELRPQRPVARPADRPRLDEAGAAAARAPGRPPPPSPRARRPCRCRRWRPRAPRTDATRSGELHRGQRGATGTRSPSGPAPRGELFSHRKMTGTLRIAAMFTASCQAPSSSAPSPNSATLTWSWPSCLNANAEPDRDGQRPAHRRRRRGEAVRGRGEVERAALAPVDARGLAQDLREHAGRIHAARQQVAVVAVRGVGDVAVPQVRERRHARGLLADVDVEVADVVGLGQADERLLEAADPEHRPELGDELVGGAGRAASGLRSGGRGGGDGGTGARADAAPACGGPRR